MNNANNAKTPTEERVIRAWVNDTHLYMTRDKMLIFIRDCLGLELDDSATMFQCDKILIENLNDEILQTYCDELQDFGLSIKAICNEFDVAYNKVRELMGVGKIHFKEYPYIYKGYKEAKIYVCNIPDVIRAYENYLLIPMNHHKPIPLEMTASNVAQALYVIDQSAQKSLSENHKSDNAAKAAETRFKRLDSLKCATLRKLLNSESPIKRLGTKQQEINGKMKYYRFFELEGYTFYAQATDIPDDEVLEPAIADLLDVGQMYETSMKFVTAKALLERFVQGENLIDG